jgi:uncharacterized protein (TIGR02271 family)
MAQYTIVTMFKDRDVIGKVQQELRNAGVTMHDQQMLADNRTEVETELERRKVDRDDIRHYLRGVDQGYPLLVGTVDEADLQRTVDILDNHGPVDMRDSDETSATTDSGLSAAATGLRDVNTGVVGTGTDATTGRTGATERGLGAGNEEVIPITEEELRVGKRTVERGGVRVRSYVVETPVEESVRLRDETVHVERRAVSPDRPAGEADFQDRTIEVTETDEEAVVSKRAQVIEEVVIRKDVAEHEKTVSDTVRRTEVEVDNGRTDRAADVTPTSTDRTRTDI